MHARKPRIGLVVAAMVVALYGMQGAAHASSASSALSFFGPANHFQATGLDFGPNSDRPIGDCWMFTGLGNGSYVEITGNNNQDLHMDAVTSTDFTRHADIWHNDLLVFKDSTGKTLFSYAPFGAMSSPPMVPRDGRSSGPSEVYTWDRTVTLPSMPPTLIFQATQVQWTSSC